MSVGRFPNLGDYLHENSTRKVSSNVLTRQRRKVRNWRTIINSSLWPSNSTYRNASSGLVTKQEKDWKMSLTLMESHAGHLTCSIAASPLQPQSPHQAGKRWLCPCLSCHTPWSGNSVNSLVSPERPLAGMEYTGWSYEGHKRAGPNCDYTIQESSQNVFILEFNTWKF